MDKMKVKLIVGSVVLVGSGIVMGIKLVKQLKNNLPKIGSGVQ